MKSLDPKKGEAKAESKAAQTAEAAVSGQAEAAGASVPSVQLDLSKVKVEPLFEDMVDFETFSKSDFRVVKVEACEAVPKSKKLLKFTLNDGSDQEAHHFTQRSTVTMSRNSWLERPVWPSSTCRPER